MLALIFVGPVAIVAAAGGSAIAADPIKKYPPYPDVWGRELPDARAEMNFSTLFSDPTGRVVVFFNDSSPKHLGKRMVLDYFTGEIRESIEGERDSWIRRTRENPGEYRRHGMEIVLGSNDFIDSRDRNLLGRFCWHNFNSKFWRADALLNASAIKYNKMLFTILDDPVTREQEFDCGFFHEPFAVTYRVRSHFVVFLPLEDGTFLISSDSLPVVIRMRQDLTSPFIRSRKYFLVDTSLIDSIEERVEYNLHRSNEIIFDLLNDLRTRAVK
ncbi:MAG: hypothetical protein MI741_15975 [Rhodospirillales bacterium]|nr:hypothetical protein [Rhodospirillales bacterium]